MRTIEIVFNGSTKILEVTQVQARQLEDAIVMGKRFFQLGDKNYNIQYLETWKYKDCW